MNVATSDIRAFATALPPTAALLGIDHGSKTIGVAISDRTRTVASPLTAIKKSKFARNLEDLRRLAEDNAVGGIVVGLPLNMDGTIGPSAQSARAFATNLAQALLVPVLLWDERLSTAAVTRMLIEGDASRRRRASIVDETAAAYILQGALDRLSGLGRRQS
jgi:putative holliday junction resolvase